MAIKCFDSEIYSDGGNKPLLKVIINIPAYERTFSNGTISDAKNLCTGVQWKVNKHGIIFLRCFEIQCSNVTRTATHLEQVVVFGIHS
jgi:hypothetical protein